MAEQLQGTGMNPTIVANNILQRAFRDHIDVSPMKLQKILFFVTCIYQRTTGKQLLTESFQPWKYGPVVRSVYDEFRLFHGDPITRYAQDAKGSAFVIDESAVPGLAKAMDSVWDETKGMSAVYLSRVTHRPNSAWWKAWQNKARFVSNTDMANDHTFEDLVTDPENE